MWMFILYMPIYAAKLVFSSASQPGLEMWHNPWGSYAFKMQCEIVLARNAWHSQACSPRGIAVTPSSE